MIVRMTDRRKLALRRLREKGYDDGYAGRPAHMAILEYQRAYIAGREQAARDRDAA